jgi:hypothetical protein
LSLAASLVRSGLSQANAEHYAALIEAFSARQAKLMAEPFDRGSERVRERIAQGDGRRAAYRRRLRGEGA